MSNVQENEAKLTGKSNLLDIELNHQDIQSLSNVEGVGKFFAKLGYNVTPGTTQTPENLGITAEGTIRPIKRIELLSDQDGLFQVYLFELSSVTVSNTRNLARIFRNRAGNYLLVLTSDYERLDFVLLQKYLPTNGESFSGIKERQVAIRPRVLSVERRKPGRVDLRVLRRFTWTESDPFAQYDKLLSAYAIADWSEEFFNNRALFSDHYLQHRLREFPEWKEDPKPAYKQLRDLYLTASQEVAGAYEDVLRKELLEPTFNILGFGVKRGKESASSASEPDYTLVSPKDKSKILAHCLCYPWGRSLDGKDDQRDKETPDENPGAVVVSLLELGDAPWVVVTNGKHWRLYAQQAHSRATNYYEIDLEETLALVGPHAGDPAEAFRYFWLLFRHQSFETKEVERDGRKAELSFLDRLLLESFDYAKKLGDRLKDRVFELIFPHLAQGFVKFIQERDGTKQPTQESLDRVYQGTLTFLYRILFLLYAEARDLLPVKEVRGYYNISISKIRREIAEKAERIADDAGNKIKKHFREDSTSLYDRLNKLFNLVDNGDSKVNVPFYNGGLFLSKPDSDDGSPEAQTARFLGETKVADRYLARALDLLARDIDEKSHELVFVDYKSLGVRQLGSIYEGLLEFKIRVTDKKLAIVKKKKGEVYQPFTELNENQRNLAERQGRVIRKGQVYLENDKHERKATGSYYTPDYIVKYIVEHTVAPVLQGKFDAMRPKFRDAQRERTAFFNKQKALKQRGIKPEPDAKADLAGQDVVNELFDIKVLDPAMGSGHFLVETVDYITDKILNFLNAFPWNPVLVHLSKMRDAILRETEEQEITIDAARLTNVNLLKRYILKRCIYGVDLNPMAVELAKVSLWLDCFTLGAPLSFLDHHLRCGNSLIGITEKEFEESQKGQMSLLSGSSFSGAKQAVGGMIRVGALPDVTPGQARESRKQYSMASATLAPVKRLFDVYTSQWFGNETIYVGRGKKRIEHNRALEFLRDGISEKWAQNPEKTKLSKEFNDLASIALNASKEKRFFHWELEFPEVFYGARPGTTQVVERLKTGGFDAVIGNPPYDVLEKERGAENWPHEDTLYYLRENSTYHACLGGKINLYRPFILRGVSLARQKGYYGQIVPMSFLGDISVSNTRRYAVSNNTIILIAAFPQKDDPNKRVFYEAKLSTCIIVIKHERVQPERNKLLVKTYPANTFDDTPKICAPSLQDLRDIDPEFLPIPVRSQEEIEIAVKLHRQTKRLHEVSAVTRGEINQTIFRRFISSNPTRKPMLKGVEVKMFGFNETLSQGKREYFDEALFETKQKRKRPPQQRIATQRITGVDESKRLVCAISTNKAYYADSTNSVLPLDGKNIFLILGLLNSRLLNWRFSLTSTNNNVGTNELEVLPFPNKLSNDQIAKISTLVQKLINAERAKSEAQRKKSLVELFTELNVEVYDIFGLTDDEIAVIEGYSKT